MPYKDQEKQKEYYRKWRETNPEKQKEYCRKWKVANREKQKESNRKWKVANPEKVRGYHRRQKAKHPERVKAHHAVEYAIKSGKLIPLPCEVCGKEKSEAHHEDYSLPLSVRWLCRRHHVEQHKIVSYGNNNDKGEQAVTE